ncbi:MAG TPA: hypothetical protein VF629_25010 [Hymenobacter sp.]|jgi:hypothetical protein|uniref:PID-CTERM protein-sorting domain-containing protein n=1 Tax=Hymenobacter sp. TaxID=1898978 RepID=UPI002ED97D60
MKKHTFLRLTLAAAALWLSTGTFTTAQAQPGTGGPTPGTPATPDPTAVPIDGGVSLLVAAGVGLGLRRLRRKRTA